MTNEHLIGPDRTLDLDAIRAMLEPGVQLRLSQQAEESITACRNYLDQRVAELDAPIYGINTGFGSLYNRSISNEDLDTLQRNLVMSHACGTGDEVPVEVVRLMMLLKAQGLSYGHSGVQLQTVQRLLDFFNQGITPVVYQLGSLGASGDLAPLAHMSLPILGLGEVRVNGDIKPAAEALAAAGLEPIELHSKEGLALLNGTQFMSAFGVHCLLKAERLMRWADVIGALSLEAYDGRIEPFLDPVHRVRPHQGQRETARVIRELLAGSELIEHHKTHVQDPYSFRCMPQVHGASKDLIDYARSVFLREINAVTDNPTIFPEEDLVISAGNFHGQPLALALDSMCIALAELGSISERRTYSLLGGERGLPAFLVEEPGLNSGFMIPQYTAASIVSQNKQLCTPASVDTIDSSNGQEDHVSMGANAATKAFRVAENVERILAIELFNASQGMVFRRPLKTSAKLEELLAAYRAEVPEVKRDKVMYLEMQKSVEFLRSSSF